MNIEMNMFCSVMSLCAQANARGLACLQRQLIPSASQGITSLFLSELQAYGKVLCCRASPDAKPLLLSCRSRFCTSPELSLRPLHVKTQARRGRIGTFEVTLTGHYKSPWKSATNSSLFLKVLLFVLRATACLQSWKHH